MERGSSAAIALHYCGKCVPCGTLGGVSLGECAQKGTRQLGIHVFVVAYRNTTRDSIEAL